MSVRSAKLPIFIAIALCYVLAPCAGLAQSDFQWTFDPVADNAWAIQSASDVSSRILTSGPYPIPNPTLQLPAGKRYEVTINNPQEHPFQIIAKGILPESDTVLLSVGDASAVGDFETDPDVGWKETALDNQVKIEFTLTQDLVNAMREKTGTALHAPGYRCGKHPAEMRGDFIILGAAVGTPSPESLPVSPPVVYTPSVSPTPSVMAPAPTPTPEPEPTAKPRSRENLLGRY